MLKGRSKAFVPKKITRNVPSNQQVSGKSTQTTTDIHVPNLRIKDDNAWIRSNDSTESFNNIENLITELAPGFHEYDVENIQSIAPLCSDLSSNKHKTLSPDDKNQVVSTEPRITIACPQECSLPIDPALFEDSVHLQHRHALASTQICTTYPTPLPTQNSAIIPSSNDKPNPLVGSLFEHPAIASTSVIQESKPTINLSNQDSSCTNKVNLVQTVSNNQTVECYDSTLLKDADSEIPRSSEKVLGLPQSGENLVEQTQHGEVSAQIIGTEPATCTQELEISSPTGHQTQNSQISDPTVCTQVLEISSPTRHQTQNSQTSDLQRSEDRNDKLSLTTEKKICKKRKKKSDNPEAQVQCTKRPKVPKAAANSLSPSKIKNTVRNISQRTLMHSDIIPASASTSSNSVTGLGVNTSSNSETSAAVDNDTEVNEQAVIPYPILTTEGTNEKIPREKRKYKKRVQSDSIEAVINDVSLDISTGKQKRKRKGGRRGRRPREKTPEEAETKKIDTSVITMHDLCRDLRIGKKSRNHDEIMGRIARVKRNAIKAKMQLDNTELAEVISEMDESTKVSGEEAKLKTNVKKSFTPPPQPAAGPRIRIVDGQIVTDEQSLQIDRHKRARENACDEREIVEENDFTRIVTSGDYLKRERSLHWDLPSNELFWKGLRMFGTDFEMIAKMFPHRNRRQVKLKFNAEERCNPQKINRVLTGIKTEAIDLDEFQRLGNFQLEELADIRAEQAQIELEHAALKT